MAWPALRPARRRCRGPAELLVALRAVLLASLATGACAADDLVEGSLPPAAGAAADGALNWTAAAALEPGVAAIARQLATTLPTNLVRGRPVLLSSVAGEGAFIGDGYRLADGDTGTEFLRGQGCAETSFMAEAWARVDFGREVPVAEVSMWTRTDSDKPGLYPIDLFVGNVGTSWRENLRCATGVRLSRTVQPTTARCLTPGRYLWIVSRLRGPESKPLSLCEVEAIPKGPTGTMHMLQTIGEMFDMRLSGAALHPNDRIRIVASTVICGLAGSSTMDPAVLDLTSPLGPRASGHDREELWPSIQIDQRGLYKVCWCGNVKDCSVDEHFGMQVATINVNGIIMTMGGNGHIPHTVADVPQGQPSDQVPLKEPWGVVASGSRAYVSEYSGHRVRWMDLHHGKTWTLAGQMTTGFAGDGGPAHAAELNYPMGLAISRDGSVLYIAESGSHRIRRVQVGGQWPQYGVIDTVAGSRYRGYSGDGGLATDARLNQPSAVALDVNDMLWISDYGNNVIRVVSLTMKVRVPGTNEFRSKIILTAAGTGQDGLQGSRGDGGMSPLAQVGTPMAVSVGSAFLTKDLGRLPTSVYVAEEATNIGRSLALNYQNYVGTISTILGTGEQGFELQEAQAEAALKAKIRRPAGIVVDEADGVVYVSDTSNNRLLQLPTMEYVSLGCWRENIEQPWIPSLEPRAGDEPSLFLDGLPEARSDAINKCAQAALQRGFLVFAVRQIGACASSERAHLYYTREGSSTSCANGLGGARDNSVYMFARPGMMVEQLGVVYAMAGREGQQAFAGDLGTAWKAGLNRPAGLSVNPTTRDLWVADTGNNRVRLVFNKVGPHRGHQAVCTNGFDCVVEIEGNGLQPGNRLAVVPLDQRCGEPGATFLRGFATNPTRDTPSPSFTKKAYSFGFPTLRTTGTFRLCYCALGATVFGERTDCEKAWGFVVDAGLLQLVGPESRSDRPITVRAGIPFDLMLVGLRLSVNDRIRLVNSSQPCGQPGAEQNAAAVLDGAQLHRARSLGNQSASVWTDVQLLAEGGFRVCWCRGPLDETTPGPNNCRYGPQFTLEVSAITVEGPTFQEGAQIKMGVVSQLVVAGRNLGAGDRIRIVDAAVPCGSDGAKDFSASLYDAGTIPYGMPDALSSDGATWTGLKIRRSGMLRVCWCGRMDGCAEGADFSTDAQLLEPQGPMTQPQQYAYATTGTPFSVSLDGLGFVGTERIRIVDRYTQCGTLPASAMTMDLDMSASDPAGAPTFFNATRLRWDSVVLKFKGWYRVCYCGCEVPGACCLSGLDFFVETGAIFVNASTLDYTPPAHTPPSFPEGRRMAFPAPVIWAEMPKDLPYLVTVDAKTRDSPVWAGSFGPIELRLYDDKGQFLPKVFELKDLTAGGNVTIQDTITLALPAVLVGIELRSKSTDAWFCEYVDVTIEDLGTNRFSCMSWAAMPVHRSARRVTEASYGAFSYPALLPRPAMEMWENRYFPIDPCGGCPVGFACMQSRVPLEMRLRRELMTMGRNDSTVYGICKPVCGDGFAAPGEQCDDGNTRDFDGCSGQCQLEQGFECRNFHDVASRCYPRLCDETVRIPGGQDQLNYGQAQYDLGGSLGYMCSADLPLELQPPMDEGFLCYPWQSSSMCPITKTPSDLRGFQFTPGGRSRVDCSAYEVSYLGPRLDCSNNVTHFGYMGEDGYGSYEACAQQCFADPNCDALEFHIDDAQGGSECTGTLGHCKAFCHLLRSCGSVGPQIGMPDSDRYHVGRKVMKPADSLGGKRHFCSELPIPRPIHGIERGGLVVVEMDGPVALPAGVGLGQGFDCSHLLIHESRLAVGGDGATCTWTTHTVLNIVLGISATLGYIHEFDGMGHFEGDHGSASLLFFDSRRLRPLGVSFDYWVRHSPEEVEVFIRRDRPNAVRDGGRPRPPRITLRGPPELGGCGPMEVFADVSSMGGGRRWRKAVWTCIETRPDARLDEMAKDAMYSACKNRIQPILDAKPWCHGQMDPNAEHVAQPCELQVLIPSTSWCGLSKIKLQVELTSADGYSATGEWSTMILPSSRVPIAAPMGPTELTVSPQRVPGDALPRLRLEVSTQTDITSGAHCSCNLTRGPATDGSESKVVVQWYHGEVRNGVVPCFFEMTPVPEDENPLMNILVLPLKGLLLRPTAVFRFVARVAYSSRLLQEAVLVPFTMTVGPIGPPKAHLVAPTRVNNEICTFIVDASGSSLLDMLYWMGRRLGEDEGGDERARESDSEDDEEALPYIPEARELQQTPNASSGPTQAPTPAPLSNNPQQQGLLFKWSVKQLLRGVDDGSDMTVTPSSSAANRLSMMSSSRIEVDQRTLTAGLYVFSVQVRDSAFPTVYSEASTTIEIFDQEGILERSVVSYRAPSGSIRAQEAASTEFWQSGFGSCPNLPAYGLSFLLLLRSAEGLPVSSMQPYAEVPIEHGFRIVRGSRDHKDKVFIRGNANMSLFQPGFQYAYRLLTTQAGQANRLPTYKDQLLQASPEYAYLEPTQRMVARETPAVPQDIYSMDTEPFTILFGPTAGSLQLLEPANGRGIAMQDIFRFQQTWATDHPPLQHAYFYGKVPEHHRQAFEAAMAMGYADRGSDDRLLALVEGDMVPMGEWSEDPSLATPMPSGMYVFEGRVRDATGEEARRAIAVNVFSNWQTDVVYAADKLRQLNATIRSSRMTILQMRAANRGAVAVVPICTAVQELPDLHDYDFGTMMVWNATSGVPNPLNNQPIYGRPIVPFETRRQVVLYLNEVIDVFRDMVSAMADNSLGGTARRLSGHGAAAATTDTPTHVQVLAQAFRRLAESVGPVLEPELFVRIAQLVSQLLNRIRLVGGDVNHRPSAPEDLLTTISALVANMGYANLPRSGIIEVNVSDHVQVRLSGEVMRATGILADALGAFADFDRPMTLRAVMPTRGGVPVGDGPLQLTVVVRRLSDISTTGVTLTPDFQAADRWPYPSVQVNGLGPPGFQASNWAGPPTAVGNHAPNYRGAVCSRPSEAFLERVVVMLVSWPMSPVMYSQGSLVGSTANITLPYSLQLRSCGQPLVIQSLSSKLTVSFRLKSVLVRERRWGYHGSVPYRVSWWEDIPGVGAQDSGIRRWTTHGCTTQWQRSLEDVVQGRCDRFPGVQAGSVFAVELVPRPAYIIQAEPARNSAIHNIMSWFMVPIACFFLYYWMVAGVMDKTFWPSEKHFLKIHFIPAEHRWRDVLRKGRGPREGMSRMQQFIQSMTWRVTDIGNSFLAVTGVEALLSIEVRELRCMRSGKRDLTYQRFVDAIGDRDRAGKLEEAMKKRAEEDERLREEAEAAMAALEPPPDQDFDLYASEQSVVILPGQHPSKSSNARRAAWPEAEMALDNIAEQDGPAVEEQPPAVFMPQPPPPPGDSGPAPMPPAFEQDPPPPPLDSFRESRRGSDSGSEEQQLASPSAAPAKVAVDQLAVTGGAAAAVVAGLPAPWREVISESHGGRVYYYNTSTGEATWDRSAIAADGSLRHAAASGQQQAQQGVAQQERPIRPMKLGTLRGSAQAAQNTDPTTVMDEEDRVAPPNRGTITKIVVTEHFAAPPADREGEPEALVVEDVDEEENMPPQHLRAMLMKETLHGMAPAILALGDLQEPKEPSPEDVLRQQVARSAQAAAESGDIVLPAGWVVHSTNDGKDFYVNSQAGITQWDVPRLPQHWEERFSSSGKVYYLCLFDGRTQWHWPTDDERELVRGNSNNNRQEPLMLADVALPGGMVPLDVPPEDTRSEAETDVSSAADAIDQLDSNALLAMKVQTVEIDQSRLPPKTEPPPDVVPWGVDRAEKDWNDLKTKLQMQKAAQETHFTAAKENPGVREFIRPHEMTGLTNNWDRQLDNVAMKVDGLRRENQQLGHRSELTKDELRSIFPIAQRLQWTKWSAIEMFWHTFQRARPTQAIYANQGKPTKKHRAYIYGLFIYTMLLASTLMAFFQAPVREDVTASMRATWTLFLEVFTMPFQAEILLVAIIADLIARISRFICHELFFSCSLPALKPPLRTMTGRKEQMRYWHELAEMGKWVCIVAILLCIAGTIALCSLMPQPRAAGVARAFAVAMWFSHLLYPLTEATIMTGILRTACKSGSFDGLLTVCPSIMDFLSVGVKTPEFLSWRVQRIVNEEEMMGQVYNVLLPSAATKVAQGPSSNGNAKVV